MIVFWPNVLSTQKSYVLLSAKVCLVSSYRKCNIMGFFNHSLSITLVRYPVYRSNDFKDLSLWTFSKLSRNIRPMNHFWSVIYLHFSIQWFQKIYPLDFLETLIKHSGNSSLPLFIYLHFSIQWFQRFIPLDFQRFNQ